MFQAWMGDSFADQRLIQSLMRKEPRTLPEREGAFPHWKATRFAGCYCFAEAPPCAAIHAPTCLSSTSIGSAPESITTS